MGNNKLLWLFTIVLILFSLVSASAVLLSDQGTEVRERLNGTLLASGDLTITIYDSSSGGNTVFSQMVGNAIINGSWNLMISPNLEYGKSYWKDYSINGEDLDFDGNERMEFQSPLGLINNASFFNFSLITACPAGSSIRLIYANGTVECESDDSGSGSSDLTNYALKNQSETFSGNITTTQTGLFGWLGSVANRITKLWVVNINATGNIETNENVTARYVKGDGSLLSNLPAGSESDPIFVAMNSTLWNVLNGKLNTSDQNYNDSVLIMSINTSSNIRGLGFYNRTEIDSLLNGISGGNASWNQTYADTLYYPVANPSGFINASGLSLYNDSSYILGVNSSLWSYINSNSANWLSSYNVTYASILNQTCASGYYVYSIQSNGTALCRQDQSGVSDVFNQVLNMTSNVTFESVNATGDLYIGNIAARQWLYNQSTPVLNYISSYEAAWLSTYNSTYAANMNNYSFNQTLTDSLYASAIWGYNQTGIFSYNQTTPAINDINARYWNRTQAYNKTEIDALNSSWTSTYNATYAANLNNLSFNQTLTDGLYVRLEWGYNQSLAAINDINSRFWNRTQTYNKSQIDSFNASWSSTYNATYAANINNASFNQTLTDSLYAGASWNYNQTTPANTYADSKVANSLNLSGTNANQNINVSFYNITSSGSGLFGWLGSVVNRVSKLWVVEINATGNIETSENVSARYVKGDGSLLTNLPSSGGGGTAKSIISGGTSTSLTVDMFFHPYGYQAGISTYDEEFGMAVPMAATVHNITVYFDGAQGSGDTCEIEVQKASDCLSGSSWSTILVVSAVNAVQSASDTTSSGSISAGECMRIFFDEAAGSCVGGGQWSFVMEV